MNDKQVKNVACGGDYMMVLKYNGQLWSCGGNSYGQSLVSEEVKN